MTDLLQSLNDKQQEAVLTTEGPVLVVAGAGSGKTKALTHRIAYLVGEKQVLPSQILAVTFTNKAAGEMKERIAKLLGTNSVSQLPLVGTFHSICVRLLRKHIHLLDYDNSFVIYDSADQQILVKRILKELNVDEKKFAPKAILAHISEAKNHLITPDQYQTHAVNYFTDKVSQVYVRYQAELAKNNALDFDDLLMKTVELLETQSEVLTHYQERFRYICVDEYQDTNQAQYYIIKMLAAKYRNLCVIGDSDQSIYSWRGANMQNILDFEKDYPEAKVVVLEQNYRSTKKILAAADNVISKNVKRRSKTLWTDNEAGSDIKLHEAYNEREEAMYIVDQIQRELYASEAPQYRDFAVLYRTNAQSRVIEEAMIRHGIPYRIVGGIKFYERKEIKDLLAYLRLVHNSQDSVALARIINVPTRGIGAKSLEKIQNLSLSYGISAFAVMERLDQLNADITGKAQREMQNFVKLIHGLKAKNHTEKASAIIKYVIETSGYKEYLLSEGQEVGESRIENIRELISVASKYDSLDPGVSLAVFLEEVALIADTDNIDQTDNSVTLMTIHAAKGLEFKHVFLIGLEEGIFPHSRSLLDPEQFEEERRLMYVGITRAEEVLHLTHSRQRMLYGETKANNPSPFLMDIDPELYGVKSFERSHTDIEYRPIPDESFGIPQLQPGQLVKHDKFGEGRVIGVAGGVVTVAFADPRVGVKKLALSVAKLVPMEDWGF